jgi:4'-phosphopantetheinyl transferase
MLLKVNCHCIQNSSIQSKSPHLKVYYGETNNFRNLVLKFYNYLSEREKKNANRFKNQKDFCSYVSVHALLRLTLSDFTGEPPNAIKIEESNFGKPFLQGKALSFSLSRRRDVFIFTILEGEKFLGTDIENVETKLDFVGISREHFSHEEYEVILSTRILIDRARIFYEFWTRKEALLKAIGIGINSDLNTAVVIEGENVIEIRGILININEFFIKTLLYNNSIISIASPIDFCPVIVDLSNKYFLDI